MVRNIPEWLAPTSLEEALELRTRYGDDAVVVAGGTFIGILMSQKIMVPQVLLTLRYVRELAFIEGQPSGGYPQDVPLHDRQDNPLPIGPITTPPEAHPSAALRQRFPTPPYTLPPLA